MSLNFGNPVGWIERFFRNLPFPYLVSALVGITVLLIYGAAGFAGIFNPSGTRTWGWVMVQPILIGLELAGLYSFFGRIRSLFAGGLDDLYPRDDITGLREVWEEWIHDPWNIIQIIAVLFILDLIFMVTHKSEIIYADQASTAAGILFMVFNILYFWFKLVIFALILLILMNLVRFIHQMNGSRFRDRIRLNLMAADPYDDLRPVRDLFLRFAAFYFVCLTLENINSFSSSAAYGTETESATTTVLASGGIWVFDLIPVIVFIGLIIAGLGLFLSGTAGIRNIVRGRIEGKIGELNRLYEIREQDLLHLIGLDSAGTDAIAAAQAGLDALSKQRERMAAIYTQSKGYTLPSLVEVGSAFLASVIVCINQITQITDFMAKYGIKLFG